MAFIVVISLLSVGLASLFNGSGTTAKLIQQLGVGQVQPLTMIAWSLPTGSNYLIQKVILANMAQPILSFMYFS